MAIRIQQDDTMTGLDRLIAEARARLAKNPDYIALSALEKARAEIVGVTTKHLGAAIQDIKHNLEASGGALGKRVSQLAGAAVALEKAGHPMQTRLLMEGAKDAGAVIGGDNPLVNFGSSLSKSDKFRSVKWQGEYAWWFAGREIPSSRVRPIRPVEEAAE